MAVDRPEPAEQGQIPALAETPTFAAMRDPLSGPLNSPLLDPLLDPTPSDDEDDDPFGFAGVSPLAPDTPAPAAVEARWSREWASGDWAVSPEPAAPAQPDAAGDPHDDGAARHRSFDDVGEPPAEPVTQTDDEVADEAEPVAEAPAPQPEPQPPRPEPETRPEPASRLSDADRDLLARLQAEMGQSRPRVIRRAGVVPNNGTHRGGPPDAAG